MRQYTVVGKAGEEVRESRDVAEGGVTFRFTAYCLLPT